MSWGKKFEKAVHASVPLIEARKLAKPNAKEYARLEGQRSGVQERFDSARSNLDRAYTNAFDGYLSPFAVEFARLKHVDLDDLPVLEQVPALKDVDVRVQKVAINAVKGLASLAGGSAVGASAGALTFSAVSTFAAASTGTAIGSLSGAAATSATLAWLGGGSIAAGGGGVAAGTAVLTGLVAAPVLIAAGGFLYWQGKKSLNEQKRLSQELRRVAATLSKDCDRVMTAVKHHRKTSAVVRDLTRLGVARLPAFRGMLDANDDFASYPGEDRAQVAQLAGLAQTLAAILACPILDEKGNVNQLAEETLAAARSVAHDLAA